MVITCATESALSVRFEIPLAPLAWQRGSKTEFRVRKKCSRGERAAIIAARSCGAMAMLVSVKTDDPRAAVQIRVAGAPPADPGATRPKAAAEAKYGAVATDAPGNTDGFHPGESGGASHSAGLLTRESAGEAAAALGHPGGGQQAPLLNLAALRAAVRNPQTAEEGLAAALGHSGGGQQGPQVNLNALRAAVRNPQSLQAGLAAALGHPVGAQQGPQVNVAAARAALQSARAGHNPGAIGSAQSALVTVERLAALARRLI